MLKLLGLVLLVGGLGYKAWTLLKPDLLTLFSRDPFVSPPTNPASPQVATADVDPQLKAFTAVQYLIAHFTANKHDAGAAAARQCGSALFEESKRAE